MEQADPDRITNRGGSRAVLRRHSPALVERGSQPLAPDLAGGRLAGPPERRSAGQGLETAGVAAAANDGRVVRDLDVAHVAGTPLGTAMEPAVRDDPSPDPGPDLDHDDVVVAGRDTRPPLAQGQDVDVVVDPDGRAVPGGEPIPDRIEVPAGHDRRRDRSSGLELDRSRDADPDPPQPPGDRSGR